MAQPTLAQVLDAQLKASELEKRARNASRDASRAQAQARDMLIEFCEAAGIPITTVVVEASRGH